MLLFHSMIFYIPIQNSIVTHNHITFIFESEKKLRLPVELEWWCQNACQLLSDNINWQHESYKHIMYLYTSGWHSTSFNGVFITINLLSIWIKCFCWKIFIFLSMKICINWEKLKLIDQCIIVLNIWLMIFTFKIL